MKSSLTLSVAALLSSFANAPQAATPADVCTNLAEARGALVTMLSEVDSAKLDNLKASVHTASAKVDTDLTAMAAGPDAEKAKSFSAVWAAFKNTREGEIIPALYAGDRDKAKGLATGIQAERMKSMKGIMGCQ